MRALTACCVLAALAFAGCATSMRLPDEFLQLRKGNGFRAVTADDARLWVRTFDNPEEGNLPFWSRILEEEFARNRGYTVKNRGDCNDAAGHEGRWLECTAQVDGESTGYLVAVFLLPKNMLALSGPKVCVCEYGAREPVFQQHVEAVRGALATLSP
jgi:hypothetical protein